MELIDNGAVGGVSGGGGGGGGVGELAVVVPPPMDMSGSRLNPLYIDLIVKKVLSHLVGKDKETMITTGQLGVFRSVCKTWYRILNDYFNDAGGRRIIKFRGAVDHLSEVDGGEGDGERIVHKLEYFLNGPLPYEESGCTEFIFEPCFFTPRALIGGGPANNLLFKLFARQYCLILKSIKLQFDSWICPLGTNWEESADNLMESGLYFPSLRALSVMVNFSSSLQHKNDPQITSGAEIDHFLGMEGLVRLFLENSPNLQGLEYGVRSDAHGAFLERHEQDSYSLLSDFPPRVERIKLDVNCSDGRLEKSLVDGTNLALRKLALFSYKYSGDKFPLMAPILQKILELHASTLIDLELYLDSVLPPPGEEVLLSLPNMPKLKHLCILDFALLSFPTDVEASFPKLEKLTVKHRTVNPNLFEKFNFKRLSHVKFPWKFYYERTGPSDAINILTSNFPHLTRATMKQPFQFLADLPTIFSHLEHLEELVVVVGPPRTKDHMKILLDSLLTGISARNCSEIILNEEVNKNWGNLLRSALVGVEDNVTLHNLRSLKKFCLNVNVQSTFPVVITDLGAEFIMEMPNLQVLDVSLRAVTEPTVCKLRERFHINYNNISTGWQHSSDPTSIAKSMVELANSRHTMPEPRVLDFELDLDLELDMELELDPIPAE